MKDNFNLKKFLVENKTIEKLNPYFQKETLNENNLRKKIREIIINELNPNVKDEEHSYLDYDEIEDKGDDMSIAARLGLEDTNDFLVDEPSEKAPTDQDANEYTPTDQDANEYFKKKEEERYIDKGETSTNYLDYDEESLEEAKEDEPKEDVETEETEEDVETEETEEDVDVDSEDGLENVAADMEGDEGDLMNNLMGALKIAKGMNNEKLATQIGNTLKFFVSEYISDKE